MEARWRRRKRRRSCAVLRFCAALWLVFYIAYTPIHLYLEPHSDVPDDSMITAVARTGDFVANEEHDGDKHHERHPAAQHKFKVTQPVRTIVAETVQLQAMELVEADRGCLQQPVFGFSGLSPPELLHTWQFLFRAALPVRAPSRLS